MIVRSGMDHYRHISKRRSIVVVLLFGLLLVSIPGCSLSQSTGSKKSGYEDTNTVKDRRKYLEGTLKEREEPKDGEQAIIITLRPKLVLHLDEEDRISRFEALNEEAKSLKKETKKAWKEQFYLEAVDAILEQATVDGYISDNNPIIDIEVISGKKEDMTERLRETASERMRLHGISAEYELHEDSQS